MAKTKIIEYYVREVYGTPREYIKDETLARQVSILVGTKTINAEVRGLLQTISGGAIQFKQVFA